jgi:hypothetical protein
VESIGQKVNAIKDVFLRKMKEITGGSWLLFSPLEGSSFVTLETDQVPKSSVTDWRSFSIRRSTDFNVSKLFVLVADEQE